MASKSDFIFQSSGLFLLLLTTELVGATQPQIFLAPGEPELVKYVNSSSMVTCIPSLPHLAVQWFSPTGHPVSPVITERIHTEARGNGAVALVLGWVSSVDAGEWRCEIDESEEQISKSVTLHVIQDIVFADTAIVQKGVEGATGVIRCEASGDPQPKMQWYHNGRQIPETSPRYRKVADGLVVYGMQWSDSGEYTCSAYQVSPHISNVKSMVIRFNVLHSPIFINQRHIYYAYYYGTAELNCDVIADPPAVISWSSKRVPQEYYSINNDTINSSILEVAVNDPVVIGKYTCRAVNDLGSAERTVELRNGSKPSQPKRFIIKGVNNTTVHIEVEQEENEEDVELDEADIISGYRFQFISLDNFRRYRERKSDNFWFPQGEVDKNFSENNSYLIGGLKPDTIYKIRVASLNKAGPSDYTQDNEFTTSSGVGCLRGGVFSLVSLLIAVVYQI